MKYEALSFSPSAGFRKARERRALYEQYQARTASAASSRRKFSEKNTTLLLPEEVRGDSSTAGRMATRARLISGRRINSRGRMNLPVRSRNPSWRSPQWEDADENLPEPRSRKDMGTDGGVRKRSASPHVPRYTRPLTIHKRDNDGRIIKDGKLFPAGAASCWSEF